MGLHSAKHRMADGNLLRRCRTCQRWIPVESFYVLVLNGVPHRSSDCRSCHKSRCQAIRESPRYKRIAYYASHAMKYPPNRPLYDAIHRNFSTVEEFRRELEDKIGRPVDKSAISHWLDGRSYPKSPDVQSTVADILHCKTEDIFPPRERQKWPTGSL